MSERVVFFLDFPNVDRAASDKGFRLDFAHLLNYVGEGRFLVDAHSYVPIDPRNEHALDNQIEQLWSSGYVVHTKVGTYRANSYKCDFDVEITMDVLRIAYQTKPDIVVLGSGDVDFIPLILELRKNGIRAEVASFETSASRELILKCSGFISLDRYYSEFEAQRDGAGGAETTAPEDDLEHVGPEDPDELEEAPRAAAAVPDANDLG